MQFTAEPQCTRITLIKAQTLWSFFSQPLCVHDWASAFLLDVHRLWESHFLPRWLSTCWLNVIRQGKSLEILHHSRESNPGNEKGRPLVSFILH